MEQLLDVSTEAREDDARSASRDPSGSDKPMRLAALQRSELLDSPEEEVFDRAVRLASHVLDAPVSLLSFVDDERQFFKAQTGLDGWASAERGTPLSHSFCQHVVATQAPLRVSDAREDAVLRDNLAVTELDVIAYLGVPVRDADGHVLGSLCAIESKPREWTDEEQALLSDISAGVNSELALRTQLSKAQEAKEGMRVLTRELDHRVKNLFAMVSGMVGLSARSAQSAAAMASDLRERINALSRAHALIQPAIDPTSQAARDLTLQELVSAILGPHGTDQALRIAIDGPAVAIAPKIASNVALVLHELATNAAKYGALSAGAADDARVAISWTIDAGEDRFFLTLDWRETGAPDITREPSQTGFGSTLIDMTVRGQLGGSIETDWEVHGVHHRIALDLKRLQA